MAQKYHILLSRNSAADPWYVVFGDFDRGTVATERQFYRDSGEKASNLKIVTSNSAAQSCINFVVARLNGQV